jgi:putative membrane protein
MSTTNLESKDKLVLKVVIGLSLFVFFTVVVLNKQILPKPSAIPSWTYILPMINAIFNGTCSILLLVSLYFIKRRNIEIHKQINLIAFVLSSLFLVCYILYHWLSKETVYGDMDHDGLLSDAESLAVASSKSIYYFILISHIVLAAIVLPLVLLSFYSGLQLDVDKHKKLVRYSFPIWLYVTITGVVVYFMISPFYPLQ